MPFNPRGAVERRQADQFLRIVWVVMFFWLFLYLVVLKMISINTVSTPPQSVQLAFALLGMGTAAAAVYLRFVRIARVIESVEPIDDLALVAKIRATYIVCFVLAEATSLFGFGLAFIRGDPRIYGSLYLGGVVLMLLCYPRLPAYEVK